MIIPVRPSSFAQDEIDQCLRWYEAQSPGTGDRLWEAIQAALVRISEYPEIGEIVPRTRHLVHRLPIHDFPFLLIYRRRDDYVEIVALAHTSRKPGYWRSRLR